MKKILAAMLVAMMLTVGCGAKQSRVNRSGDYIPENDYQTYVTHKAMEPKTFATREIKGVTFIKMKGKNITITTNAELENYESLQQKETWFKSLTNMVTSAVPYASKLGMGYLAADVMKKGFDDDKQMAPSHTSTNTTTDTSDSSVNIQNSTVDSYNVGGGS